MKKNEENTTKAEAKKAKILAKREALKAKKAAAKQAKLEKKRAKAEAKKAKLEAKRQKEAERKAAAKAKKEERKAKKLARLQKKREREAARKAKAKERAKLQRQKDIEKAKKLKDKTVAKKPVDGNGEVDIKDAAKTMKLALAQIAKQMATYDDETRAKKAKQISWMGYSIEKVDNEVVAKFIIEKTKKITIADAEAVVEKKARKPRKSKKVDEVQEPEIDQPNGNEEIPEVAILDDEDGQPSESVETIPVGDTYGDAGKTDYDAVVDDILDNPPPEDDNTDPFSDEDEDEEKQSTEDDEDEEDDFNKPDTTEYEQDKDLLDYRREAYGTVDDDGENNDF